MANKEGILQQKKERLGEMKINKWNEKMTIIEYNGVRNITIKFEDGTIKKCKYGNFKNGCVDNPNRNTIYNIACIGDGVYKSHINGKRTKSFDTWHDMIRRCYSRKSLENRPTYKDKLVYEEWLNFQNFSKWFDENYYEIENDKMCLDKDILFKDNNIYSPDTCIFVPNRINILFTKRQNKRGKLPIGVTCNKVTKKYKANCSTINSQKYLGTFNTPEEAFNSYKTFKENYIKQVADEYKDKIPKKLYDAMYKYEVDITD